MKENENSSGLIEELDEQTVTEIVGLFDDVPDHASLDEEEIMRRICECLEMDDEELCRLPDGVSAEDVFGNVIILTDESGNEVEYTDVATINMEGRTFVVLQTIEDCIRTLKEVGDDVAPVYIFEELKDENGETVYEAVEDDSLLDDLVKNYEAMLSEYYNAVENQ